MSTLSLRDRELVALGAALASNCVPCIEFHVPAARKAGLTDAEISEALAVADKIRQVPAGKVLDAANAQLAVGGAAAAATSACCPPPAPGAKSSCC